MKKSNSRASVLFITEAAVIAALYVALTYVANLMGLAYGAVQFRISELLTVLPVFTPAAIPGLVIGCLISNITSTLGLIDMLFGTAATLLAAVFTRLLRNITVRGIPVLSTIPPVIFNGIIIAFEIWFVEGRTPGLFWSSCWTIALGEAAVCVVLGIPFIAALKRIKPFARFGHGGQKSGNESVPGAEAAENGGSAGDG